MLMTPTPASSASRVTSIEPARIATFAPFTWVDRYQSDARETATSHEIHGYDTSADRLDERWARPVRPRMQAVGADRLDMVSKRKPLALSPRGSMVTSAHRRTR